MSEQCSQTSQVDTATIREAILTLRSNGKTVRGIRVVSPEKEKEGYGIWYGYGRPTYS